MTDKRRHLRQLVEAPEILVLPGVYNGFSVRLVEQAGYAAAAISGAGVSESLLGWADKGILTFDQNLYACRAMAACTELPLLADADTGYGNAVNVHFTARAFEDAGLCAISIEDQVWPKRCGHMAGKQVIPAAEMVSKVKAAVDARRDPDFMIRARTDAAATHGISEVIDRLNMYAEAGADIVFADALLSAADIEKVARSVPKPLSVNMGFGLIERGTTPLLTPRQLQGLGACCVSYSRHADECGAEGHDERAGGIRPDDRRRRADRTARPDGDIPGDQRADGPRAVGRAGGEIQVTDAGSTAALARFIAGLDYEHLPAPVVARAKACILDAIGCVVYGTSLPWTRMLIDLVEREGGNPRAGIPGTSVRTSVQQAVLVGATAGHGFELDDIHGPAHLHCGSLALPVALALAEAEDRLDGRVFITAIVAGYEVGLRVGLAATGALFMRGHHFQGTCGTFVAAATAARMLGLDAAATHNALGIAGSLGAGLMAAQEGAMSKRLHCGRAAEAGVLAAYLAQRGFTGITNVLEADYGGFLSTLSGAPQLGELTAGLGATWEILNVGFKPYATAASVQSVLCAIDGLMRENGLTARDIERVEVHCSTMAHRHCAWPYEPKGVTAAQMNMMFTAAMMIHDRAAFGEQFRQERLSDPAVLAIIDRISVAADPRYDVGGDKTRHAARVAILTGDGRRLDREMLERPGSPGNPMTPSAFAAKLDGLVGAVLPADRSDAIRAAVAALEDRGAAQLCRLLALA